VFVVTVQKKAVVDFCVFNALDRLMKNRISADSEGTRSLGRRIPGGRIRGQRSLNGFGLGFSKSGYFPQGPLRTEQPSFCFFMFSLASL
jgi:hypothetical protein